MSKFLSQIKYWLITFWDNLDPYVWACKQEIRKARKQHRATKHLIFNLHLYRIASMEAKRQMREKKNSIGS